MKAIGILAAALTALGVAGPGGGRARRRGDLRHQQHGGDHRPRRPAAAGSPEGLRARGRADHRRRRRARARLGAARRRVLLRAGTTTFERSRVFDVDRLDDDELHTIADTIRARFGQQSVLTFEPGPAATRSGSRCRASPRRISATGCSTTTRRASGCSAARSPRTTTCCWSPTRPTPTSRARSRSGSAATSSARGRAAGDREFVEGPLPVRVVKRTLIVDGTADDDAITLARRFVTLNGASFNVKGYDRVRVDGGDGLDTLAIDGRATCYAARRPRAAAATRSSTTSRSCACEGDAHDVGDLSATDTFQVDGRSAPDRATVLGSEDDDQISIGSFGVLGPTFVRVRRPRADRPPDGRRPRRRRHHQRVDRDDGADARRRRAATTCCSAAPATTC